MGNTKIIDISSYYRRAYALFAMVVVVAISIAVAILGDDKYLIGSMVVSALVLSFAIDYIIKKDKIVLDLGNMLVSKHKEFFLYKGMKSIDKLRIRNELDYDEEQIIDALGKFINNNSLSQYNKIYITGSHSSDDVNMVSRLVNGA